jgi:para-aminobenzoate synthetase component 1
MLNWATRFNIFCFLDNRQYSINPGTYECLLGAGIADSIQSGNIKDLDSFVQHKKDWIFGHLSYELKGELHGNKVLKQDPIGFPHYFFFRPQETLCIRDGMLHIYSKHPDDIYRQLMDTDPPAVSRPATVNIQPAFSREAYTDLILKLQAHIRRGDCYEINFCQEFFANETVVDPAALFERLLEESPNPFSAFYRLEDRYLVCASPERFLSRQGDRLISQPIKGTIRRDLQNPAHDAALRDELFNSGKDRSENVMVVDLVRNDLSRICEDGSVKTEELYGVYAYPQVYQMISTISGIIRKDVSFSDLLKATFPMGSMTGAPKHRVMELIDRYEPTARGIFSGSVGYMEPGGDFDFNVVIRSIMYNHAKQYLSYQVGSGITFYSDPVKEWEECMLKGMAIKKVLTGGSAL